MAVYLMKSYPVSTTRACKVIDLPKSMFYYQSSKDDQPVIDKLNELVSMRVNHKAGQDKLYERIRSEGIPWNYKKVRRVYLAMGLKHRQRTKRRLPKREKQPLTVPIGRNMSWSMDFSFPSHGVVRMLERAIREYGIPMKIRVDNGPEFTCSVFVNWCAQRDILIQYIQPGRPMQNAYIERFNRTFRQDVLDAYIFEDLYQFREITEEWLEDYNNHRPHESLNNLPPLKYQTT
jgi:putative transposase